MDKKILVEYIDACELLKETEIELENLRKRGGIVLQDSVKGSMHDFPYAPKTFHMEGVLKDEGSRTDIRNMERILEDRAAVVRIKKEQAEKSIEELASKNPRIFRIFRYKFMEGMTWNQVAEKIGRKANGESVRKEWERFIKENR